mmetsp:Transcript_43753/g.89402  ORF Transcript_43753/g.89402 Transcript_43753/m.89402 type:complete len:219 (+) Transcript_43753:750-1406(+)
MDSRERQERISWWTPCATDIRYGRAPMASDFSTLVMMADGTLEVSTKSQSVTSTALLGWFVQILMVECFHMRSAVGSSGVRKVGCWTRGFQCGSQRPRRRGSSTWSAGMALNGWQACMPFWKVKVPTVCRCGRERAWEKIYIYTAAAMASGTWATKRWREKASTATWAPCAPVCMAQRCPTCCPVAHGKGVEHTAVVFQILPWHLWGGCRSIPWRSPS